jgi:hypothetical protein
MLKGQTRAVSATGYAAEQEDIVICFIYCKY